MEMSFTSKIENVSLDIDSEKFSKEKDVHQSINSCSDLKWNAQIETRSWGIKGFHVIVPDQELTVYMTLENWATDEEQDIVVKVSLKDAELARDINNLSDLNFNSIELELSNIKKIDEDKYEADATASVDF